MDKKEKNLQIEELRQQFADPDTFALLVVMTDEGTTLVRIGDLWSAGAAYAVNEISTVYPERKVKLLELSESELKSIFESQTQIQRRCKSCLKTQQ